MTQAPKLLILNGPNLNTLGHREPGVYGTQTYSQLEKILKDVCTEYGFQADIKQSNHEGELIDFLQDCNSQTHSGIVFNPAAYSHTSIALADCITSLDVPVIEVHISNIYARENFRHHSYVSPVVDGVISGCGTHGYELAVQQLAYLAQQN